MPKPDVESLGRAGARAASTAMLPLTEEQCWYYLRGHKLGRVAIVVDGRPQIFPISYAAGRGSIVFRTAPGTKLKHGMGAVACFEIDSYDENSREGWSVMATGPLEEITDAADARSLVLRELHPEPLAPGARNHWVALHAEQVTGRHFGAGWTVPGAFLG